MGGLKIFTIMICVLAGPVFARSDPLIATFATCAGRFSAELEHAWLMRDAGSLQIEARRLAFLSLLDASTPTERQRHALHLRIRAKAAHSDLLAQASFSTDADRARWARRRAGDEIASCAGFLLKS